MTFPFLNTYLWEFRDPHEPLSEAQRLVRKALLVQVEADPESLDMSDWETVEPECTTTRCIAGWVDYLVNGRIINHETLPERVAGLLGLTQQEYNEGTGSLFYVNNDEALARIRKLAEEPHYEERKSA